MVDGRITRTVPPIPQNNHDDDTMPAAAAAAVAANLGGRSACRRLRHAPAGRGALGGRHVQPAVRRAARLDHAVSDVLGADYYHTVGVQKTHTINKTGKNKNSSFDTVYEFERLR